MRIAAEGGYRRPREVVIRLSAAEARELAVDIADAWPYPDGAWRDAEALFRAADEIDPPNGHEGAAS